MLAVTAVLISIIGIAFLSQVPRLLRANQPFTLTPNCLMTREPIVFLNGRKSFFYFLKYWNGIPHFLREHGYEVYEISQSWIKKFEGQKLKPHWIVDDSCPDEVKSKLRKIGSSLHEFDRASSPKAVLQYAIHLAESEQ